MELRNIAIPLAILTKYC